MIHIPIRTVPGMNVREHWQARSSRVKRERRDVAWFLKGNTRPALPCTVVLTRCAPSNGLDDDNLAGSLKSVRDEIAVWLGVDDKHRHIVRYEYRQQRAPWGVRIEFGPSPQGAQLMIVQPEPIAEKPAPTKRRRVAADTTNCTF